MEEAKNEKPSLVRVVGIFSLTYVIALFVAGWINQQNFFAYKISNSLALIVATYVAGMTFYARHKRCFTGAELVKVSLGAFAVDLVIQCGVAFLLVPREKMGDLPIGTLASVLLLHLCGILFFFGPLLKMAVKANEKARERKQVVSDEK